MEMYISLHDLLKVILYLSAAGVLIYLVLVLKRVLSIVKKIDLTIEENQDIIDDTLKKVPTLTDNAVEISKNVNTISAETSDIMVVVKPEIEKIITTVGNVTDTVGEITRSLDTTTLKVTKTVSNVSDTISDTAKTISSNANNLIDYFYILKEVLESLKEVFLGK